MRYNVKGVLNDFSNLVVLQFNVIHKQIPKVIEIIKVNIIIITASYISLLAYVLQYTQSMILKISFCMDLIKKV